MKANIKIISTTGSFVYINSDNITNVQLTAGKNSLSVFTAGSLSITFTLSDESAADYIMNVFNNNSGELSTTTPIKTVEAFQIGDSEWKRLKVEHADNPEEFNRLVENRVTKYYYITAITISGGSPFIGSAGWEADSSGDLMPLA